MSFLILAFRKLSLKRKINNGNYQLMQMQLSQDKIQRQISDVQKVNAQLQDNWTTVTSSLGNMSTSIFSAQYNTSSENFKKAESDYKEISKTGTEAEIAAAKEAMEAAKNDATKQQISLLEAQNNQAMSLTAMKQAATNIFDENQKAQLETLQKEDQRLDLERTSLQDQLTSWNAEYSNLDKSVGEAAKNAAPQYVA